MFNCLARNVNDTGVSSNIKKLLAFIVLLMLLVNLQSCGFRLRGSVELPPEVKQLAIEDLAEGSKMLPVLVRHLKRSGITPMEDPGQAKLVVVIQGEKYKRRVLTVSSAGQVQEFELEYNVNYSIKNVDDMDASLMDQKLTIKEDLRFDATAVLGKASEEDRLQQDMINAAAERIMRRIPKAVARTDVKG